MQFIIKFHKGFNFLLSVIDIYSKFVWMVTSNEKNGFAFINRERSKIWLDKAVNFIIDQ